MYKCILVKIMCLFMKEFDEKILIVGTFNEDLESGDRMRQVLANFKPGRIVGGTNQLFDLEASTRELVWAVLFDEREVPQDLQNKWHAIQTHKEHLVAQQYAASKRIPYFMIDADESPKNGEILGYTEEDFVEYMKKNRTTEEIISYMRKTTEEEFDRLKKQQNWTPRCKKYYREDFLCKGEMPNLAEKKAEALSAEFMAVMQRYPDSKIFGFFDGTQIVKPTSIWATRALGRPMQNLRYILGENGIKYGMLVDLI
ncbi:hypothetical protein C0416_04885 [bacterium]|nr:hypothetical protein [bacterium]